MSSGTLSSLQRRILVLLADMQPAWTLTGGAALAGVYLGHRTTRDLDLFWRGATTLGASAGDVEARLRGAGLSVAPLERHPGFVRLRVGTDGGDVVVVDLVAEPVASVEPPAMAEVDGARLQVDTRHEILVNKLCALVGRAEIRDLIDVRALLAGGGDLVRALRDAPGKDAGFSVLTLGWLLRELDVESLAGSEGMSEEEAKELAGWRDRFLSEIVALASPS